MTGVLSFTFDYTWAITHIFAWQHSLGVFARHAVEDHGYIAMFSLLFFSGAGLPLPEDVPLIAAGVCIARGTMTWAIAGPVAWLGMMVGDTSLYVLGYIFGRQITHLPLIGRHIKPKRLLQCEGWFTRWGLWAVGIGRMFAGVRTAMVVAAGTLRFNYLKMLAADSVAAIVSGGAFMVLGYQAGLHAGQTRDFIEKYRQSISPIALGLALGLMIFLYIRSRKRAARAKAAAAVAAGLEAEIHMAESAKHG